MKRRITGPFEVKLIPQTPAGDPIGRMAIEKTFQGALSATSIGAMLAIQGAVAGSAGYVAMERVTGLLEGREGAFALQHSGRMDRGARSLAVGVVPDSGTGALVGLAGTMDIEIIDGKHLYSFDYTLPED